MEAHRGFGPAPRAGYHGKDVVRMPLDGIEGVSIRYEPMHAEWQEPHELEPWLRAQIEGHPTDSAGTS